MMRDFPEADWKVFKKLSPIALELTEGAIETIVSIK
jgi:hypothetical protein